MIDQRTIFEIHRLAHEGLSVRKIATTLGLSRQTTSKYLADPTPPRPLRPRPSQLDPFKDAIAHLLEIDPKVSAVVLRQRLAEQGFTGGHHHCAAVPHPRAPGLRPEAGVHPLRIRPGRPMPDRLGPFRRHGLWRYRAQTLLPAP